MTARYLTTSGSPAASSQPGGCGCGQPPGGCDCDTGCLTRPRFYCGMVLTDDQLNDLEDWVRRRSALHRYVEGWGVVRGLAVRCDPGNPGGVLIGPGYARSCCGDDIVLCADVSLDVCACGPKAPCCDDKRAEAGPGAQRAVDLYLQYTETPQDPAKVMASCGCGGHDSVQYERVAEGGTVVCVPVADPSTDPATLAAEEWGRGYMACSAVVDDYLREMSGEADTGHQRTWLLGWIDRAGDDALCCIRRSLCRDGLGEAGASGVLLEIVYALRQRYLETTYGECRCPEGVLLARVWLRDDKGACTVDCVDALPPYRRVITPPGWPQLPGSVNVAGLIWQRRAVACDQARQLGLRVGWSPYSAPEQPKDLAGLFENDAPYVPCDAECEAWLYHDRCGRWPASEQPDGRVLRVRTGRADL